MITLFADVILPLPLPNFYTYRVPSVHTDSIKVGARVIVQFGSKKILTAIVAKIHETPPSLYEAKSILNLLDDEPLLNSKQLNLMYWMSSYYMCHNGDVLQSALPTGLKLSSESKIQRNPNEQAWKNKLMTDDEQLILDQLVEKDALSYSEVAKIVEAKNIYALINALIKKEAVIVFEEVKEKYTPKIISIIKLCEPYLSDIQSQLRLIQELEAKPKQQEAFLHFLSFAKKKPAEFAEGISKSELLKDFEFKNSFDTLLKNRVFEEFKVIISRIDESSAEIETSFELSSDQQQCKDQIIEQFKTKDTVLLHGITGSGKTEIYIELIKEVLSNEDQVLFLLPEIALTTQIVSRLRKIFGNKLGIYHSKYSDNERVDIWKGVKSGELQIIVGVRSSLFLPFDHLGLIIVDEEHENSYKQYDTAPRYHARDTALVLASKHHAKVLLGSATPAIESYYNAVSGKWGLVKLDKRFGNSQLPRILLIDVKKDKKINRKVELAPEMIEKVYTNYKDGNQTILFQNRRGYAPYLSCEDCGFVPQCNSCSVSLTYHQAQGEINCHYCGHHERVPSVCPACGSTNIKTVGFGTEKLEEEVQILIPQARIKRMDLDTTRSKNSYQMIIQAIEKHEVDILIGTQMVTKGLDFDKVTLVGVFDLDRMIHFPDFRSNEKVFQIATQVSGRAGRKSQKGTVLIQTSNPSHPIFEKIIKNDYLGIYNHEIREREKYNYPPFCRIIKIELKNEDRYLCEKASHVLADFLKNGLGTKRVLGPESPVIDKIRNLYIKEIFIKLEKNTSDPAKAKLLIKECVQNLLTQKEYKSIWVIYDVDIV